MNRCAVAILRILLIAAAALTESVLCQTPTPTTIPKLAAMPREVREEVDRLASNDAGKRATGAVSLGQMGAAATQAIPYLVPLLGDSTEIWSIPLGKTTVSHIAGYALVQIGAKGTEVLISQLKRENQNDMYMRNVAATVLAHHKILIAAPVLRAGLTHPDVDAFEGIHIIRSLVALGDSGSLTTVMTFLSRDSIGDWYLFPTTLKELTGQDFKTKKDALEWWQKNKEALKEKK